MTVFPDLHRSLRIPDDYHFSGSNRRYREPKAPAISNDDRKAAVIALMAEGELPGPTEDDLLHALCARLAKLRDFPGQPLRVEKPIVRMRRDLVDLILANPEMRKDDLAELSGYSEKTIRRYRKQLREEGRIA